MTGGWRIAVRNLSRNRRRNAATALAIAFGYAALVVLGGYANRVEGLLRTSSVYLQHVGHLSVLKPGGLERAAARPAGYSFTADEQETVRSLLARDRRVEFAARLLRAGGLAGNGCKSAPFQAVGVDLESERRILAHPEVRRWTPELGRPVEGVSIADAAGAEAPVALSVGLATSLGKHAGRPAARAGSGALDCASPAAAAIIASDPVVQLAGFDLEGGIAATDASVVAVYRAPGYEEDKSSIVADVRAIQQLLGTDRITSFSVYLRDPRDARSVERDLASGLAAAGVAAEIRRYDDADLNPYYVGSVEFVHALVAFMGLLLASIATLSVLNAMTLTILERTRELATFRSLGFTRRQVLGLFLREAAALTGVGVALGLAIGLSAAAIVNGSGVRYTPPGVAAPIPLLVIPTPLLCVSIAAAYLPLSIGATWIAVRRRVAKPVAHLLTAVAA